MVYHAHHWKLGNIEDEVCLAECVWPGCGTQQYQPAYGTREGLEAANLMNRRHGYPEILIIKRPKTIPEEESMVNAAAVVTESEARKLAEGIEKNGGDAGPIHAALKDKTGNIKKNRGAFARYDAIADQVIADAVALGTWSKSFAKHDIPNGSLTGLAKRWRAQGHEIPEIKRQTLPEKSFTPHRKQIAAEDLAPIPQKPVGNNVFTLHKYYAAHTAEIIEDYRKMGQRNTLRRWGISSSKLAQLIKENQVPRHGPPVEAVLNAEGEAGVRPSATCAKKQTDRIMLEVPAFNEAWGDAVKVEWLHSVAPLLFR